MIGPVSKVPVYGPDGKLIQEDAVLVPVVSSNEPWTEAALEDGTKIRIKQNIVKVYRVEGKYDVEGNPQYILNSTNVISIDSPQSLKKVQ